MNYSWDPTWIQTIANYKILVKIVSYNKLPKMKRDTRQKSSPFPEKKTAFLSGISSFLAVRHTLRLYRFVEKYPFNELLESCIR